MPKSTVRVKVKHQGYYSETYLKNLRNIFVEDNLKKIAEESLEDFRRASPNIEIASNWSYTLRKSNGNYSITFENSTFENGTNIAVLIDVGHGTLSGKWIPGTNYLKEPIKKTYEKINKLLMEAPQ